MESGGGGGEGWGSLQGEFTGEWVYLFILLQNRFNNTYQQYF